MNPIEQAYEAGVAHAVKTAAKREKKTSPGVGERVLGGLGGALGGGLLGGELGLETARRVNPYIRPTFWESGMTLNPLGVAKLTGLTGAGIGAGVGSADPRTGAILAGSGVGSQLGALGGAELARALGGEEQVRDVASIGKLLGAVGGGLGARALTD